MGRAESQNWGGGRGGGGGGGGRGEPGGCLRACVCVVRARGSACVQKKGGGKCARG
ncbi:hypothetical protein ABG752_06735 [Streptococcus iniae]